MQINNNTNSELVPLTEILETGTLFRSLHKPYKIVERDFSTGTDKELLMNKIQAHKIALIDLKLYLDVCPNVESAVSLYNELVVRTNALVREYEKEYGPITDMTQQTLPWSWMMTKWPWEGNE